MATEPSKPTRAKKKPTGRKPGRPRKKPEAEKPEPTPSMADAIQDDIGFDFSTLIDVLVPPATIEVVDAFGNEHKLVTAIPARSQIQIFRIWVSRIWGILGPSIWRFSLQKRSKYPHFEGLPWHFRC